MTTKTVSYRWRKRANQTRVKNVLGEYQRNKESEREKVEHDKAANTLVELHAMDFQSCCIAKHIVIFKHSKWDIVDKLPALYQ